MWEDTSGPGDYSAAADSADKKPVDDRTPPYWMYHAEYSERAPYADRIYEFDTPRELVDFAEKLEGVGFDGPSFGWDTFLEEYPHIWMCGCGRGPVVCVNGHPRYRDEDPLCVACCEEARPTHGCPDQDDVRWD